MPMTYIPCLLEFFQWSKLHAALSLAIEAAQDKSAIRKDYEDQQIRLENYFSKARWSKLLSLQEIKAFKDCLEFYKDQLSAEKVQAAFMRLIKAVEDNELMSVDEKYLVRRMLAEARPAMERIIKRHLPVDAKKLDFPWLSKMYLPLPNNEAAKAQPF